MPFVYAACPVCVTISVHSDQFQNFTKLHALTLAACSYALLYWKVLGKLQMLGILKATGGIFPFLQFRQFPPCQFSCWLLGINTKN